MKTKIIKLSLSLILVFSVLLGTGCRTKEPQQQVSNEIIELTYYKMFDDEDVMFPLIKEYQQKNPRVKIRYKKFENLDEYYDLVVDELAEGEGPDIFSAQNHWFLKNRKKINPAPLNFVPPADFSATFVEVATKDLVLPNEKGQNHVYGIPLTVDTLALYYNKDHFEDRLPQQGKPSSTWEGIKDDVFALTKTDTSFERFQVAGAALGRSDNISRAFDVVLLMMIQNGVAFYDKNIAQIDIPVNQGAAALDLYTSFADSDQKNYSWNRYIASKDSPEKELSAFARGKVSMIAGYSYLYDDILRQIEIENAKGQEVISKSAVRVAHMPQIQDPAKSTAKRDTYASYFAETVSRTSKHPEIAWDFLLFLVSKENQTKYFDATNKPTSRRDMITEQKKDPIFGVFVDQIGFAESVPMTSYYHYKDIFEKAIDSTLANGRSRDAVKIMESEIQALLPQGGMIPEVKAVEE